MEDNLSIIIGKLIDCHSNMILGNGLAAKDLLLESITRLSELHRPIPPPGSQSNIMFADFDKDLNAVIVSK